MINHVIHAPRTNLSEKLIMYRLERSFPRSGGVQALASLAPSAGVSAAFSLRERLEVSLK